MIMAGMWLYGKPAWDLKADQVDVDAETLRVHGDFLHQHLYDVAEAFERLIAAGWNAAWTVYSVEFFKEGVSMKEAKNELKRIGVERDLINLVEVDGVRSEE